MILRGVPYFIKIGSSAGELWRYSDFQVVGRQPCWSCCGVMINHPRSVVAAIFSNFGLIEFTVLEAVYFRVLAWNCLFTSTFRGRGLQHISSKWRHRSSYPQKALPCVETRRLSHKAWKSVQRFDLGARSRKKKTGQSKKSQRRYISPSWGETPPSQFVPKFAGRLPSPTCAKFRTEIFKFLHGSNFRFSYWFLAYMWPVLIEVGG